jgi:LysM repeat protein
MQNLRDFGNALVVALISIGLMIGALSISLVEFVPQVTPTAADSLMASPIPLTATNTLPPTLTPTLGLESPTPSITPTSTITSTPPASCPPPLGWGQIIIQPGDTLDGIAARYRISKDELRRANCLLIDSLVAGTVLYAPSVPTITPAICNPGAAGWVKGHSVKPGETFFSIAANYYTAVNLLKSVNCRISDLLYVGEVLWVPNVATRTPYPTPLPGSTITPYPTDPLTQTALPFTVTVIPSDTPIPATATDIPTATAMPTFTASPTAFPIP